MQFRLVEQRGKAGTGGASAALQLITRTSTNTALPSPLLALLFHPGHRGPDREWGTEAGWRRRKVPWSRGKAEAARISPESVTWRRRLKPLTAAPLSPARRVRRQVPSAPGPSWRGQRGALRKVRSWGTCVGAHRGTPGKVGARTPAASAEREARLPLPPAAPPPALRGWVSAGAPRPAALPPRAGRAWGPLRVRRRALGAPADARRTRLWSPAPGGRG